MAADSERARASSLDCISYEALLRIAMRLGAVERPRSRATAAETVVEIIGSPAHRSILEQRLTPLQWALLDSLAWTSGQMTTSSMVSFLAQNGAGDGWEGVAQLFSLGCFIDPLRRNYHGSFHFVGDSVPHAYAGYEWSRSPGLAEWARGHASPLPAAPIAALPEPERAVPAGWPVMQKAAYILLTEAARKPIRFKADFRPYEADVARLVQAFAGAAARGRQEPRVEPPELWFALGILIEAHLLTRRVDGTFGPSPRAMEFLAEPAETQAERLVDGWRASAFDDFRRLPGIIESRHEEIERPWLATNDYPRPSQGALNAARAYLWRALAVAVGPDGNGWHSVSDFADFVFHQFPDFLFELYNSSYGGVRTWPDAGETRLRYPVWRSTPNDADPGNPWALYRETDWQEVEGAFVKEVIGEALWWLGIVELAPDATDPQSFRLTDAGRHLIFGTPMPKREAGPAAAQLIVQPNFEVVVPNAAAGFAIMAELEQFAERKQVDRAATFVLTQAAFVRALDGRWTLDTVVDRLERATGAQLPQNIRFAMGEWAALHSRLTLRTGASLIVAGAEAIDRWLSTPSTAALLGARLGEDAVMVPSQHVATLEQLMQSGGARRAARSEPLHSVDLSAKATGLTFVGPRTIQVSAPARNPHLDYRLRALGDETPGEEEARFTVTSESIARALKLGWRGPDLVQFLREATGRALPIELRACILGWSGAATGHFAPFSAFALAGSDLTWPELCEIPQIGELVAAVQSPAVALVEPNEVDQLRAVLATFGIGMSAGPILVETAAAGDDELKAMLKRHRDDPESVLNAIRAAGLLGKLDRLRGYRY